MNNTSAAARASRVTLAAREAKSLLVERGTRIQALSGRVWLTQEGDARDHTIPAGTSFCTDRAGQAVLSAVGGAAVVRVQPGAGCAQGVTDIASLDTLVHAAKRAQAQHLAHVVERTFRWLRRRARAAFA